MKNTFIIAEAGANHNKNLEQALQLVDIANIAGAHAVKFQTYSSETLYSKFTPNFSNYQNIPELIKSIELPREWQKTIKEYCDENNIEFMSTPFDEKAVDELMEIGIRRFKIAGFESSDPRLVKYISKTKLPIIFSAGIGSTIESVRKTVDWILEENPSCDITILHCNNAYPTPLDEIYLQTIPLYLESFPNCSIGLSDHTMSTIVPALAVSMGASVIEKHFTINRQMEGPDHPFAMEPHELSEMVYLIRQAEITTSGYRNSNFTESEQNFKKAMRSVVAKKSIKAGETLSEDNITTKRPFLEDSIPASSFYEVIGKIATEDIEEDELLTTSKVKL